MKKYIIFLLVFLALTAVQCKKSMPEEQLPPITTSGANTFGCLVNGQVWLSYSLLHDAMNYALWVQGPITGTYQKNASVSIFTNNERQNENSGIDIFIGNLKDTGVYRIYNNLNQGLSYSDNNGILYEPLDTYGIVHVIRLDTIQQIVSGTFSFKATNTYTNKTFDITNGRFDVHWPYKQ